MKHVAAAEFVACQCPHCGGTRNHRHGKTRAGAQRWLCKNEACGRSWTADTGMAPSPAFVMWRLQAVLRDMFAPRPSSCRALGERLGVSHSTVWRMRHFLLRWLLILFPPHRAVTWTSHDADVIVVRESWKGSRTRRPRGVQYILFSTDRAGHIGVERLDEAAASLLRRVTRAGGMLVTQGVLAGANAAPATGAGLGFAPIGHLAARYHRFMRPFRGVATKYLDRYLHWLTLRQKFGL